MQKKLKNILIHNDDQWFKISENNFEITIGPLDSAESSELVGQFILYNLIAHSEIEIKDVELSSIDGMRRSVILELIFRTSVSFQTY